MTKLEQDDDSAEILRVLDACHAAMVGARTDELDKMLEPDYSLVHITGYRQPKEEWFDVIEAGDFNYHKIDIEQRSLSVSVTGNTAVLAGRGIFDATINGMRSGWPLQFRMMWAKRDGRWRIASATYTGFHA
jgi:ketosteroid isomerase-like protein